MGTVLKRKGTATQERVKDERLDSEKGKLKAKAWILF